MRNASRWGRATLSLFAALITALAMSATALAASPWVYLTNYNAPAREGSTGTQLIPGTGGTPCKDGWVIEGGGETPGSFGTTNTATGETDCFDPSTLANQASTATAAASMTACSGGTTSACVARADESFFQVPVTMNNCRGNGTTLPTIVDGIVAAGGYTADTSTTATSEIYDPAHNAWYGLDSRLSVGRWGLDFGRGTVELEDGSFLVLGGNNSTNNGVSVANVDRFNPATCTWTKAAALDSCAVSGCVPRNYGSAGVLQDGRVVVCGGFSGRDPAPAPQGTCEVYTPSTNKWAPGPSLNGGRGIGAPSSYKMNDTTCSTSTTDFSCGERLPGTTSTFPEGRILVATGVSDSSFSRLINNSLECNATACTSPVKLVKRGTVTSCSGALCKGTQFSNAALLHAGALFNGFANAARQAPVLLCGGYGRPYFDVDNGCEVYTPSTNGVAGSWHQTALADPLPTTRVDMMVLETCGGGGGSLCSTGAADQVIAAGGSPAYSDQGITSAETTEIDRLTT